MTRTNLKGPVVFGDGVIEDDAEWLKIKNGILKLYTFKYSTPKIRKREKDNVYVDVLRAVEKKPYDNRVYVFKDKCENN